MFLQLCNLKTVTALPSEGVHWSLWWYSCTLETRIRQLAIEGQEIGSLQPIVITTDFLKAE